MHHKYVVRDGEAVWTGSMNWTDDSFTRQENVVLRVESAHVARAFTADFEQIWETGDVSRSGFVEPRDDERRRDARARVVHAGPRRGALRADRAGDGAREAADQDRVARDHDRLGARRARAGRVRKGRTDLAGVVDQTQMRGVVGEWSKSGNIHWKLPLLQRGLAHGFSGKRSAEWRPEGGLHDFMHAKVTVADDIVFVGSYNLSRSGEKNAENVVELESAEIAERLATYIDEIRALYPPVDLDAPEPPASS